ncbi:MAG: NAD(P)H-hydrate dehydratase [Lachnospiraceae bacterium]|nr:NAD(P)H-hydrate dehydratase [Lachnospiraceae bacterium]
MGLNSLILMERAAAELTKVLRKKVLFVVGNGNNGGDGVAAARILKNSDVEPFVYEVNPRGKKSESLEYQLMVAKNFGVQFLETLPETATVEELAALFNAYDVIVDAIFGVGLSRDVEGVYKTAVEAINVVARRGGKNLNDDERAIESPIGDRAAIVVGCDIPSGINADTGRVMGAAVRCDLTVTFGYTKLGMLINEGRACSGELITRDIGLYMPRSRAEVGKLFDGVVAYEFERGEFESVLPSVVADSNKGTRGKVLVISGSKDIYGAMYLCASACFNMGVGLVKVVSHEANRGLLMDKIPEAMMLTYSDEVLTCGKNGDEGGNIVTGAACEDAGRKIATDGFGRKLAESVKWADTVIIGPGLGTEPQARAILAEALSHVCEGQNVVLDADALNIIATTGDPEQRTEATYASNTFATTGGPELKTGDVFKSLEKRLGRGKVVVTPHIAEMIRLMKGLEREIGADEIKTDPVGAAQWVAEKSGAICVLKDARTVVCDPEDTSAAYINTTGNSGMSKGGFGDVLAGIVGGMLTLNRKTQSAGFESVCAAVRLHGMLGDEDKLKVGESCMMAGHIVDEIREKRIFK